MIPGSNLLGLALTVIGSQLVNYRAFTGRATNAAGLDVSTYAAGVPRRGSFQPVPRQYFAQMGLEYTKEYCNWYDPAAGIQDLGRDVSGDLIIFGGKTWEALSANDWSAVDGWSGVLFVCKGPVVYE